MKPKINAHIEISTQSIKKRIKKVYASIRIISYDNMHMNYISHISHH